MKWNSSQASVVFSELKPSMSKDKLDTSYNPAIPVLSTHMQTNKQLVNKANKKGINTDVKLTRMLLMLSKQT